MRGLLTAPLRSVGGCCLTAMALSVIIGVAAGYGGPMIVAAIVCGGLLVLFWVVFITLLAVGQFSGTLDLNRPKEGSAHVDH